MKERCAVVPDRIVGIQFIRPDATFQEPRTVDACLQLLPPEKPHPVRMLGTVQPDPPLRTLSWHNNYAVERRCLNLAMGRLRDQTKQKSYVIWR